ncbi:hypothetical protein GCM10010109_54960 [Actinoplanes campanulatus]|nr:hypothetical protein GCM10010109_54960 [Actinoplanes campanulatus]GID38271.1 hypothetical protein Aca09nite_47770 [Actinoplanes campanulatus]
MPPSKVPETLTVPEIDTVPAEDGHAPVGVPGLLVGPVVGLVVGPAVGLLVGFDPPLAYVSNSEIRGAADALVISKVSFFSDVEENVMVLGLPLPLAREAPVSALSTRQALIEPPPEACRMVAEDTVVALLHLTET